MSILKRNGGIAVTKPNKASVRTAVVVAMVVLGATVARILGEYDILPKAMGIFRSTLYIGLFVAWGLSVRRRIIGKQARRYLTAVSALMILWFVVRSLKYYFITNPGMVRYLWYLYYPALLLIPMLAVLTAISIGKREEAPLPKSAAFLYVPATLFVVLVITNDMHQLVFRFPVDDTVWSDKDYHYGAGYIAVVGWMIICALVLLIILWKKRRVADKRKWILLPCVPIAALLCYLVFYVLEVSWFRLVLGDMTAFFCLMYAAALELFIKCGFVQANTHYVELFRASGVAAQITDAEYRVLISSDAAQTMDTCVLKQTEQSSVLLENGVRLSSAPIKTGRVVWMEDVSALLRILNELENMKEELEETNQIEEEEQLLKKQEARILAKDRLYNILQRDTAHQLCMMDNIIYRVEMAENEAEKRRLLYQMLVIGSYLKRRSNLAFLAEKSSMIDAHELDLCIGESQNSLEACGIICGYRSTLTGQVLSVHIISLYEFFEEIVENLLDCECSMNVYAGKKEDALYVKIITDAKAELSIAASDKITVQKDEDGEQHFMLRLEMGGVMA